MSVRWLSFQSFQHSQELISAINTLLIHLKLEESGILDEKRDKKADQARNQVLSFLDSFEQVVSDIKTGNTKPSLGTDTRFRQLAKNFVKATNNRRRFRSVLFQNKFNCFRELLKSKKDEDKKVLLNSLEELRILVEEHLYEDMEQVLGEI